MASIKLSKQDLDYIARVVATEVPASLKNRNPNAYDQMSRAVVDTILNRVASPSFPNSVKDVVNQDRQFSKIAGPRKINPYGSVEKAPKAADDLQNLVEKHVAGRAQGAPSTVGGNLHYANPYHSDRKNQSWIAKLAGPVLGVGKAIHKHGTTAGYNQVGDFDIALEGVPSQDIQLAALPTIDSRPEQGGVLSELLGTSTAQSAYFPEGILDTSPSRPLPEGKTPQDFVQVGPDRSTVSDADLMDFYDPMSSNAVTREPLPPLQENNLDQRFAPVTPVTPVTTPKTDRLGPTPIDIEPRSNAPTADPNSILSMGNFQEQAVPQNATLGTGYIAPEAISEADRLALANPESMTPQEYIASVTTDMLGTKPEIDPVSVAQAPAPQGILGMGVPGPSELPPDYPSAPPMPTAGDVWNNKADIGIDNTGGYMLQRTPQGTILRHSAKYDRTDILNPDGSYRGQVSGRIENPSEREQGFNVPDVFSGVIQKTRENPGAVLGVLGAAAGVPALGAIGGILSNVMGQNQQTNVFGSPTGNLNQFPNAPASAVSSDPRYQANWSRADAEKQGGNVAPYSQSVLDAAFSGRGGLF